MFCKSFYTLPLDIRAVEGGVLQNVTFLVRFYTPTPSTGSVGHVELQNELQISAPEHFYVLGEFHNAKFS